MMAENKIYTAIGLMSGTSLDGIDVALLKTDGESAIEQGATLSHRYTRDAKIWIQRAIKAALEGRREAHEIAKAIDEVTQEHINAVRKFFDKNYLGKEDIDIIGFHGQTILHRPPQGGGEVGFTWQIGSGSILAEELGIDVIADFRANDMRQGGEGAPFAPVYHAQLVREMQRDHPVGVLNLGGVANITWVPESCNPLHMVAFDCGPGNGLIDEWVETKTGEAMDQDGAYAKAGTVDEQALQLLLLNRYLKRPAPKSLDRYDFKIGPVKDLSLEDGAATLTAFTAAAVEKSVDLLPQAPGEWVAVGGGAHNPVLMAELEKRLSSPIKQAEELGWRPDFLEAECFAYLAVRSLKKLPISYPKTTRVPVPLTGGVLHEKPF